MTIECAIYHSIITEMLTSWERLVEDAERLEHDAPDLGLMLTEAQALHAGWESDAPSYLRAFLDNGMWGSDQLWDNLARKSYSVFLSLYLLPFSYAEWMLKHLNQHHRLPNQRTLYSKLCEDEELLREMDAIKARASDATQSVMLARCADNRSAFAPEIRSVSSSAAGLMSTAVTLTP